MSNGKKLNQCWSKNNFVFVLSVCVGGRYWSLPLFTMACSANHSKGSSATSALGAGIIVGQPAWLQRKINLRPQHRGVHVVTEEILRQVSSKSAFKNKLAGLEISNTFSSNW